MFKKVVRNHKVLCRILDAFEPFTIIDDRGDVIGTVDEGRVFSQAHPGAVYLHQGDEYLIANLDPAERTVTAHRAAPGYYTQPHQEQWVGVIEREQTTGAGRFGLHLGRVEVESQVLGFKRRSIRD